MAEVGPGNGASFLALSELDTTGNAVPAYKAHSFTYDDSGNVKTDSVGDGVSTWVKTYTYTNGQLTADSGWVKQ